MADDSAQIVFSVEDYPNAIYVFFDRDGRVRPVYSVHTSEGTVIWPGIHATIPSTGVIVVVQRTNLPGIKWHEVCDTVETAYENIKDAREIVSVLPYIRQAGPLTKGAGPRT